MKADSKVENWEVKGEEDNTREWISLQEMQEMLAIGSTKAYELVASGSIPGAVKIGRIIRINRRKLDDWLEQQTIDLKNK